MLVDRIPNLASEMTKSALKMYFDKNGIDTVIADFDGTHINTRKLFDDATEDICGLLVCGSWDEWHDYRSRNQRIITKVSELKLKFRDKLVELTPKWGIQPDIMAHAVVETAKSEGLNENYMGLDLAIERVVDLYTTDKPELFPQSEETAAAFCETGVRFILGSRAGDRWTDHKVKAVGLTGLFDHVECFSVMRPKADQWEEFLESMYIQPESTLFYGDNWYEDIVVPLRLGATAAWINHGKTWHPLPESDLPDPGGYGPRCFEVKSIGEIIPALIQQ